MLHLLLVIFLFSLFRLITSLDSIFFPSIFHHLVQTMYIFKFQMYFVCQIYSQPVFAVVERWFSRKYPNSGFVNSLYSFKLPMVPLVELNPLRLCFRTAYVVSTTGIAMFFPYFNQVLGVLGALSFWPTAIYFPVEMYFVQNKISAWTRQWLLLRTISFICFLVTVACAIGSIEGLISAKFINVI